MQRTHFSLLICFLSLVLIKVPVIDFSLFLFLPVPQEMLEELEAALIDSFKSQKQSVDDTICSIMFKYKTFIFSC